MPRKRIPVLTIAATFGLLAAMWAELAWPEHAALVMGRRAAGLALVLFWPAALVMWRRVRCASAFQFFWIAAAINIIGESILLSAATAAGLEWTEWGFAVVLSLLTIACLATHVLMPATAPSPLAQGESPLDSLRPLGAAALLLIGFIYAVCSFFGPRDLVHFNEARYWPIETQSVLEAPEPAAPEARPRLAPGPEWRRLADGIYRIDTDRATATIRNANTKPIRAGIALFVEAHREGRIDLLVDGKVIASEYAHPRFDATQHPRNYPPPNITLAREVELAPGDHALELRIDTAHAEAGTGYLIVLDLSFKSSLISRKLSFDRRYLIANIGDTRENIELARSLFRYPFPRETSYAGEIFDGGGYAISNLPFPYYPYAFAMLAGGDDVMSLGWLHVALLLGLWAVMRRIIFGRIRKRALLTASVEVLCFLSVLAYAALMRFMIESIYVHTTLTLVFLVALWALLAGHTRLFLVYAAFTVLTKGGLPLIVCLLAIAFVLAARPRREVLRTAGQAAAVVAGFAALLLIFGWATGSLDAWREDLAGDDYAGRFVHLTLALTGDAAARDTLALAAWSLTKHVLAAGGAFVVFCLFRPDRRSLLLAAIGLLFHALVCVSDPGWESWGHAVHPLNYFTPAAPLLCMAGLRRLVQLRRQRWLRLLAVILILPAAAGVGYCQVRAMGYRLPASMEPSWRSMHAACVNDYLLRRAQTRIEANDYAGAAHDATIVLDKVSRHAADYRLTYQKGKAHFLLFQCALAGDDLPAARSHLDAMRDTSPRFADVYRRFAPMLR